MNDTFRSTNVHTFETQRITIDSKEVWLHVLCYKIDISSNSHMLQSLLDATTFLKDQLLHSGPFTMLVMPFVHQHENEIHRSSFQYSPPTFTPKTTQPRIMPPLRRGLGEIDEESVQLSTKYANIMSKNDIARSVLSKPGPLSKKRKMEMEQVKDTSIEPGELVTKDTADTVSSFKRDANAPLHNLKDRTIPKSLELFIRHDEAQIVSGYHCHIIIIKFIAYFRQRELCKLRVSCLLRTNLRREGLLKTCKSQTFRFASGISIIQN